MIIPRVQNLLCRTCTPYQNVLSVGSVAIFFCIHHLRCKLRCKLYSVFCLLCSNIVYNWPNHPAIGLVLLFVPPHVYGHFFSLYPFAVPVEEQDVASVFVAVACDPSSECVGLVC